MKHQYSIDELKHRENLMQARLEDEQARREELEEHKVKAARRGVMSCHPRHTSLPARSGFSPYVRLRTTP